MGGAVHQRPERRAPIAVDRLIEKAQGDAYAIACALIPNGYNDRRDHPSARFDVDAPQGRGSSVWMIIRGRAPLTWKHVRTGQGGGVLDAIVYFGKARSKPEAVDWLLRWFGETGRPAARRDPAGEQKVGVPGSQARGHKKAAAPSDPAKVAAFAHGLWLSGSPLPGTPGEAYLRARGADIRRLPRCPGALRFHPHVRVERGSEQHFPAILAKVDGADGATITAHRIFLQQRPDGSWGKAPIAKPKRWVSSPAGGMVRLWRGEKFDTTTGEISLGRRWQDLFLRPDWAAEETLVVTEGLENGLALAIADQSRRVAAGLSLTFLDKLVLPPGLGRLILFGDDDEKEGTREQLWRAADALYRRRDEGGCRNIEVVQPDPGMGDALEILARGAA